MTVVAPRVDQQEPRLRELAATWLMAALALIYMGVPPTNSMLFASALVLQAALGTAALICLFSRLSSSLLLFCGPGLIVGGALSLVLFQISGRGTIGSIASLLTGVIGLFLITRSNSSPPKKYVPTAGDLCNLFGLACLAMSSKMSWLLIAAGGSFAFALVLNSRIAQQKRCLGLGTVGFTLTCALALMFRGDAWWLITDDYLFFESMSIHLNRSGPFDSWGVSDFSRYHWLSYGWAGLLNHLALTPDTLMTLTRVMPFVYGLALGSSILFCSRLQIQGTQLPSIAGVLPAWGLLGAFRLDWAGTSTVAGIVVLSSFLSLLVVVVGSDQTPWRRLLFYVIFAFITLLSKAPSVLALGVLVISTETILFTRHRQSEHRFVKVIGVVVLASAITIAILPLFSSVAGGFSIAWGEQRGDELSRRGLVITLLTLTGRNGWNIGLIAVAWMISRRADGNSRTEAHLLTLSLFPAVVVAVVMDALVVGVGNTNEYFSRPFLFISLFPLLVIGSVVSQPHERTNTARRTGIFILTVSGAILSAFVSKRLTLPVPLNSVVIGDLLADSRVLLCLLLLCALISRYSGLLPTTPVISATLSILVGIVGVAPTVVRLVDEGVRPTISDVETNVLVGPPDARTAALWLKDNSEVSDIVATNYLRDKKGKLDNDYSLAAWSQREFLVLGPSLAFDSALTVEAVSISEEFALKPSSELAEHLRTRGVRWYIVDLDKTTLRDWEPYAETTAMTWRFWILRLR